MPFDDHSSGRNFCIRGHSRASIRIVVKLEQNQVWKQGDEFLRIVELERLRVQYKAFSADATAKGKHHEVTKKEFCRLLKEATLLTADEARALARPSV